MHHKYRPFMPAIPGYPRGPISPGNPGRPDFPCKIMSYNNTDKHLFIYNYSFSSVLESLNV